MIPLENCFDDLQFGNKAKNLAILCSLGLTIPKGFVIPSSYLMDAIEKSAQELEMEELARLVPPNPFKGKEGIARSSSHVEDGAIFSAAGMYYSGKYDDQSYSEQVALVWKSPYKESVINFKKKVNLPILENMAVILMEYRRAELGGVLFTQHPSFSGMVLELSENGSSGVTSGEMPSKLYKLPQDMDQHKLFPKLYRDAMEIENKFGSPQDIEFLISGEEIIYLQSRPIVFKKHSLRKK